MPTHLRHRPQTQSDPNHTDSSHRGQTLELHPEIGLPLARVHEACGPARRTFAMWLAGQTRGPVLWISPSWEANQPNPDGMCAFVDPARFIFVAPRRAEDILWCVEETLRAGAVPLVIADLPAAPALTPVRRMQLAAETGSTIGAPPLGLLLISGDGGARGVDTRWHMAPTHVGDTRQWRLERRRARTLAPRAWSASQIRARAGLILERLPDGGP
jgi:protein ImuA